MRYSVLKRFLVSFEYCNSLLYGLEYKITDYFSNAKEKGNLLATYDPVAYNYADVVIVDINLDVNNDDIVNILDVIQLVELILIF